MHYFSICFRAEIINYFMFLFICTNFLYQGMFCWLFMSSDHSIKNLVLSFKFNIVFFKISLDKNGLFLVCVVHNSSLGNTWGIYMSYIYWLAWVPHLGKQYGNWAGWVKFNFQCFFILYIRFFHVWITRNVRLIDPSLMSFLKVRLYRFVVL